MRSRGIVQRSEEECSRFGNDIFKGPVVDGHDMFELKEAQHLWSTQGPEVRMFQRGWGQGHACIIGHIKGFGL